MAVQRRRALVLGFSGALVVFVGLFLVVGLGDVVDALSTADPPYVLATFALGFCWLATWSLMLRTVMGTLDVDLSAGSSFLLYAGSVFANNVTPFGQAGGEPIAALLVSKTTDARYETGLAGIATIDVCNVFPSVSLALVGVGYYGMTATIVDEVEVATASALAVVVGIVLAAPLVWRAREAVVDRVPRAIGALASRLTAGRVDGNILAAALTERLEAFVENLRLIADDRRRLAVVFGLSLLGWLLQVVALLAAFAAVGHTIPVAVACFAIPLANLAGMAPFPGGLGSIEAAYVALLFPTTGVPVATITAAVLVFRGAVYWSPIMIGGSATAILGARSTA